MKKLAIYYFSGTGNTLRVCKLIKENFEELGGEADLINIDKPYASEVSPENYDVFAIAYPVHGFNAPQIVSDYVKNFPEGKGEYYVIKSSGEPAAANRDSSHLVNKILGKKGYEMMDEFHYVMPYNMIFRHSEDMVKMMLSLIHI